MADVTPKLGLVKPAGTDYADISAINGNMDKVDDHAAAVLADLATRVPQARTINKHALDADVTLAAADVDAYSKAEMDASLTNKAAKSTQETVEAVSAASETVSVAAATLQAYLNALPRLLTRRLTVNVTGAMTGTLNISQFYGPGSLTVQGASEGAWTVNGRIYVGDCRLSVVVSYVTVTDTTATSSNEFAVRCQRNTAVSMQGVRVIGNGKGVGFASDTSGPLYLYNCAAGSCNIGAYAVGSSVATVTNTDAATAALWQDNATGAYAYRGGVILLSDRAPQLLGGAANGHNGGIIAKADGTLI